MANRILLMSASLAAVMLAATSPGAAPAADQCLAKPRGAPPAGKHWYYQTNRATKRKCWFLADEGMKVVSTKRRKTAAPANPADNDQKPDVKQPIANAHAELISEPQAEPVPPAAQPPPQTPDMQQAQEKQEAQVSASAGPGASDWALASRWPDPSIAYASATSRTALVNDLAPSTSAPAAQAENPLPVLAANTVVPVEEPTAAVGVDQYGRLAQLAAVFFLLAAAGAAMMLFFASRRRSIASLPAAQARPSIDRRPRF